MLKTDILQKNVRICESGKEEKWKMETSIQLDTCLTYNYVYINKLFDWPYNVQQDRTRNIFAKEKKDVKNKLSTLYKNAKTV